MVKTTGSSVSQPCFHYCPTPRRILDIIFLTNPFLHDLLTPSIYYMPVYLLWLLGGAHTPWPCLRDFLSLGANFHPH